ncbi:ArnT family glycosyltransferase [Paraburkholderia sabiae]|uniref:Glycosyltransferase family 39 protein n=2 Tax=Paraburkholderia sabiae TaxID=273251 RepID=A0ABU9QKC9_9BURK|nr:glycosyltransferase family 39 protein [Paraburkholderia sabiae]WJZ73489.1 glycosyltransferase family 39 protein [Paraburkholderia sabiae]CAD6542161.1 hypothetical protein LMG24235_03753 [Paraburkholderia sabiae]
MTKHKILNSRRTDAVIYILFAALLALFIYQSVHWLIEYRFGQSLDIDESGYLALSVAFAKAKIYGGWTGWLRALSAPLGFAPMAPIVASLAMIGFGVNENYGFLCNVGFAVGTLVLMFVVLRRSSLLHALLACILLASLSDFVVFSRGFQFVTPTTFFFFASFACFVLSDGFRLSSYSALVGAALGCMILSRTMAVAFLPAFAFSFLLYLYLARGFSRETLKNILLSVIVFLIVALPWYIRNFASVFGYLFSFGYGAHAAEYGHSQGIFTWANLSLRFRWIFVQMRLPHFFFVVPIFLIGLLSVLIGRKRGVTGNLIIAGSALCLACFGILWTSQNMGTGFDAPIYTVMIYCVAAWLGTIGLRWLQAAYFTLFIGFFALSAYAHQDLYRCVAMSKPFSQGFGGDDAWTGPLLDCGTLVHMSLQQNDFPPLENKQNFILDRDEAIAWRNLNRSVSTYLATEDFNKSPVLLLSRHMILNVNSIGLEMIKQSGFMLPMVQVDPALLEPKLDSYTSWLARPPQDAACFAMMLNDQHGEFSPRADLASMTIALKSLGFEHVRDFPTPRPGQHLAVWKRNVASCNAGVAVK